MAKGKSGRLVSTLAKRRSWVQAAMTLIWLDPVRMAGMLLSRPWALRLHAVCSPVLHCHSCPLALFACPIGVLANFGALHTFPFIAVGGLMIYGAVFGSFICGFVCPFGFLQDLLGKIPTPKFELPTWVGYGRYVMLLVTVLAVPYFLGEGHPLFFCRLCPAGALEAGLAVGSLPGVTKLSILSVLLVAVLFVRRPWCTIFCPLGAIYGMFNRVSFFYLRFRSGHCTECDHCRDMCHYGGLSERRAGDRHCIRCMQCARCNAVSIGCVLVPETEKPPARQALGRDV